MIKSVKEALNVISDFYHEYFDGDICCPMANVSKETLDKYEEAKEYLYNIESELKLEKDKVKYVMKQLEKQDKILEILKNKKVCIYVLLDFIRRCVEDNFILESYNHYVKDDRRLTQEEYDLIKEVLDNEIR